MWSNKYYGKQGKVDDELLNLAKAAKLVADLSQAAGERRLRDPVRLQQAMKDYDRRAAGYQREISPGDFVRQDAERFEGGEMRVAMERVAQLLDREFGTDLRSKKE